jgi:hypothetical protein
MCRFSSFANEASSPSAGLLYISMVFLLCMASQTKILDVLDEPFTVYNDIDWIKQAHSWSKLTFCLTVPPAGNTVSVRAFSLRPLDANDAYKYRNHASAGTASDLSSSPSQAQEPQFASPLWNIDPASSLQDFHTYTDKSSEVDFDARA